MTHESIPDGPRELLASVRGLVREVRAAQRGSWFPLLVFAVLTLAAIPVDRYSPHHLACRTDGPGRVCLVVASWPLVYWPVALLVAYGLITGFYLVRSRRRGVGTRIYPYVAVGAGLAVVLAGVSLWLAGHPLLPGGGTRLLYQLATPAAVIGAGLLVLARVERSRALLAVSVLYLAVVLLPPLFASGMTRPDPWGFLPRLLAGAVVLLAGCLAFAAAQHRPVRGPR
jgi:hypothetical protein